MLGDVHFVMLFIYRLYMTILYIYIYLYYIYIYVCMFVFWVMTVTSDYCFFYWFLNVCDS